MDKDEIIESFEELFGSQDQTDSDETTEEVVEGTEEVIEENKDDETTEDTTENTEEVEEDKTKEEPEKDDKGSKAISKQNYKFAELRTQTKKQSQLIKALGKAIGLDEKTDVDTIANKVQEVLLQKQSKDTNVPVEILQRMQDLEAIVAENDRIKQENELNISLTNLAEKYDLNSDELTEFALYLDENGKNPLKGAEVDLETEYIKLHYQDLIKAAAEKAVAEEKARKEKAENHAGTKVPGKTGSSGGNDDEIKTVADLEKFLNSQTS